MRRLWVVDGDNNRILRYTLPNTSADLVLGQASYTSGTDNMGGAVSKLGFSSPRTVSTDGVHLVVAESFNHRVQI